MHYPTDTRQNGLVLFHAVLLVLVLFGFTAALVFVNTAESRAVQESTARRQAFYMAEAGLEAAKWELTDDLDPEGDGVGNKTFTVAGITYQVVATNLTQDTYQLDSTGLVAGTAVTLQSIVTPDLAISKFPYAAISMVGTFDASKIHIRKHGDMIIDGGDSPAILTSQKTLYDKMNTEFEEAIDDGLVLEANITGTVEGEGLPFSYQPDYPTELQDLGGLYQALVDSSATLLSGATAVTPGDGDLVYGDADNPEIVHVDSLSLASGQSLTGAGTLIVSDQLVIPDGASLNWEGNIVVVSHQDDIQAELTVSGGSLNVSGNVVVLGESLKGKVKGVTVSSTTMSVSGGGSATVDGSLFVGSAYGKDKDTETALWVKEGGSLTVNGLVSTVGRMAKTQVDKNGNFTLHGMLQTGSPHDPYGDVNNPKLMLQLSGNIEIHKEDAEIAKGAQALVDLGAEFNVEDQMVQIVEKGPMMTVTWKPVYEGDCEEGSPKGEEVISQGGGEGIDG